MSDDAVCCIENAMFSSSEKQRSIGSFVNKLHKGFYNIPQISIIKVLQGQKK